MSFISRIILVRKHNSFSTFVDCFDDHCFVGILCSLLDAFFVLWSQCLLHLPHPMPRTLFGFWWDSWGRVDQGEWGHWVPGAVPKRMVGLVQRWPYAPIGLSQQCWKIKCDRYSKSNSFFSEQPQLKCLNSSTSIIYYCWGMDNFTSPQKIGSIESAAYRI